MALSPTGGASASHQLPPERIAGRTKRAREDDNDAEKGILPGQSPLVVTRVSNAVSGVTLRVASEFRPRGYSVDRGEAHDSTEELTSESPSGSDEGKAPASAVAAATIMRAPVKSGVAPLFAAAASEGRPASMVPGSDEDDEFFELFRSARKLALPRLDDHYATSSSSSGSAGGSDEGVAAAASSREEASSLSWSKVSSAAGKAAGGGGRAGFASGRSSLAGNASLFGRAEPLLGWSGPFGRRPMPESRGFAAAMASAPFRSPPRAPKKVMGKQDPTSPFRLAARSPKSPSSIRIGGVPCEITNHLGSGCYKDVYAFGDDVVVMPGKTGAEVVVKMYKRETLERNSDAALRAMTAFSVSQYRRLHAHNASAGAASERLLFTGIHNDPVTDGYFICDRVTKFWENPTTLWSTDPKVTFESLPAPIQAQFVSFRQFFVWAIVNKEPLDIKWDNFGLADDNRLILLDFLEEEEDESGVFAFLNTNIQRMCVGNKNMLNWLIEPLKEASPEDHKSFVLYCEI